jgi:hypothetical protein
MYDIQKAKFYFTLFSNLLVDSLEIGLSLLHDLF